MQNSKLVLHSFIHSLGVLIYISGVAWVMNSAERLFGQMAGQFWGPVAFLLLFVLSATVVGLLVLGRPVYMYLGGMKAEALRMFFYTFLWLVTVTIVVFLGLWLY